MIDYQIGSDLRSFEASIDANGVDEAVVAISVKLVSDRTGKVLRSRVFEGRRPLSSTSPVAVVDGLNEAFEDVARQIVSWVLQAV